MGSLLCHSSCLFSHMKGKTSKDSKGMKPLRAPLRSNPLIHNSKQQGSSLRRQHLSSLCCDMYFPQQAISSFNHFHSADSMPSTIHLMLEVSHISSSNSQVPLPITNKQLTTQGPWWHLAVQFPLRNNWRNTTAAYIGRVFTYRAMLNHYACLR